MLKSLEQGQPERALEADVVIVGAGLAGLFLANRLANRGLRLVVLESGGETQSADTHPLNTVELPEDDYRGAEHGRFRCLGGTSTRWGGALLPYLDADLGPHPCGWHTGWGVAPHELAGHLEEVENAFAVQAGTYEGDSAVSDLLPSFLPRLPKWPAFANRSTANIFRKAIRAERGLHIWLDSTVLDIRLGPPAVSAVVARSPGGNRLEVRASQVVIAAGAIETTRLLLLMNRSNGGAVFPPDSPLGRGFHDHLSGPIADLDVVDLKSIVRLFSFRFVSGGMRNLRFELSPEARGQLSLPGAFLHVAFARSQQSGFEGLRQIYQALQQRVFPPASSFAQILGDAPWFAQAVWWRFAERRVMPASGANFQLHLVTEQTPDWGNRIELSDGQVDSFGQPLARISWKVREADTGEFWKVATLAFDEWRAGRLMHLARPRPRDRERVIAELVESGGIYHPAGTTRIGSDASHGVVDGNLRVHGVPGLWALATSVFPAVGGSSPSLALMQFAARMADDIDASLGPGR